MSYKNSNQPVHEISNNAVCAISRALRSACAYAQSDQSLCLSLEYPMSVNLLTEHHLRFLSLKGGYTGSSESTLVKMPHCWKSRVTCHGSNQRRSRRFHKMYACTLRDYKSCFLNQSHFNEVHIDSFTLKMFEN